MPPAARDSYGQQTSGPGFLPGGTDAAGASYPAQDYQTEAYPPLPGSESPASAQNGFTQNGFADNGFAQNGFVQNGFGGQADDGFGRADAGHELGQDVPSQDSFGQAAGSGGYPQAGYRQDEYAQGAVPQDGYFPTGYDQDGYGPAGYGPDGFSQPAAAPGSPPAGYPQDVYGQGGYNQDSYVQPGFEQPSGPGYGDDDLPSRGRPPRSGLPGPGQPGPGRSPYRLSRARMVIYLAASVIGVVLIVYLVVHLTKSGTDNAASGTSTPTMGATAKAKATPAAYTLTAAGKVGSYPLNTAVTSHYASILENQSEPAVKEIKAKGAGQPGTPVVGIYNLGSVTSSASADYKGMVFVGYDGTYNPAAVIKVEQSLLRSASTVSAGPHGGEMVCGYSEPTGSEVSQCVWVTKTTLGNVEFIHGEDLVQNPDAAQLALEVRNAVETPAS